MKVLIIGSGKNVKKELNKVNRRSFDLVIGVNQAAIDHGPVDVHCARHPRGYVKRKAGYMVAPVALKGVDEVMDWSWPGVGGSGSSGLYAIKYAFSRGADDITLAGIGLDPEPHYYTNTPWQDSIRFRETWTAVLPQLQGKVRSLGGWTKDLLAPKNTFDDVTGY